MRSPPRRRLPGNQRLGPGPQTTTWGGPKRQPGAAPNDNLGRPQTKPGTNLRDPRTQAKERTLTNRASELARGWPLTARVFAVERDDAAP